MNHEEAFRCGPCASAIVGLDGKFIDVSDRFCELMGRTRKALLGSSFRDLASAEEHEADDELARALADGQSRASREKRYLLPNGDELWAWLSVAAARDPQGKLKYFVSTVDNVTVLRSRTLERYNSAIYGLTRHPGLQRGEVAEFLQHLTATISRVLEVARVGIWYWGDQPDEHIRLTCSSIDGEPAEAGTVLTARDYPAYFEALRTQRLIVADDAATHAATREFAASYLTPLGITSMLDAPIMIGDRLVGVVCHEHTGEPRQWTADEQSFASAAASLVGLAEQSSKARAAEQKLRKLNDELERRVQSRTHELESFSYSVSHDLRAPLRAMGGFSQVLLRDYGDRLDPAGRDYLSRIASAATRMGRLTDALLALSRFSHQPIDPVDIDLAELAHPIVEDLRERYPGRSVEFVSPAHVPGRGDRELVSVLLQNLIENAWKFTAQAEKASVELGVSSEANGGTRKAYYVRDNGLGFETNQASRLFEPFTKIASEGVPAGTGIGLATVMRIAQRHGGRAWAEATPGKGATFFFTLE